MSDTVPGVSWSLDPFDKLRDIPDERNKSRSGFLVSPLGKWQRRYVDERMWETIRNLNLETDLRKHFQVTTPLWFGFWIESPLAPIQCHILFDLFSAVEDLFSFRTEYLRRFLQALDQARKSGSPLYVDHDPPGHVDEGFDTTFVHCPRCKAEGPFERWAKRYPNFPIDCPVCGSSYVPAQMTAKDRDHEFSFVVCDVCGKSSYLDRFTESELEDLESLHYMLSLEYEEVMLKRAVAFREKYPELRDRIYLDDDFVGQIVLESLHKTIATEDELNNYRKKAEWTLEDEETVEYILRCACNYESHLSHVISQRQEYRHMREKIVRCPECKRGRVIPDLGRARL